MILIVKCISMYILFDQECEQALCGSEPAHSSANNGICGSLRSKVVFTDFAQIRLTSVVICVSDNLCLC